MPAADQQYALRQQPPPITASQAERENVSSSVSQHISHATINQKRLAPLRDDETHRSRSRQPRDDRPTDWDANLSHRRAASVGRC